MSYETVVAGLVERLATINGLTVLAYDPKTVQDLPLAFLALDGFERTIKGQVTTFRYRVNIRLLLRWQDSEQAELELMPYVNSIPAAIAADPHLGNRLTSGYAQVVSGDAGYAPESAPVYRVLDFGVEVVEK